MEWNGSVQPKLSPQFTWTASYPTQRPVKLPSTVPTLPFHSEEHPLVRPVFYFRCSCRLATWSGVGAESTKGKWAEQLGRRWRKSRCSANAWWWWWRLFLLRFYSILFLQKSPRNRFSWNVNSSRFPVEYTRCHILYSPPIYESKFGVPTSDFTPQKQTITKHVHIHSWSLHDSMVDSQSMVNGKYFFSYIEMDLYNQYLIPTISRHAAAQQVGFNSFPPNSAVPTLPLQSEKHHLAWWRTWSGVGPGVKIQIRRIVNQYNQIGMVLASKRSWKTLK